MVVLASITRRFVGIDSERASWTPEQAQSKVLKLLAETKKDFDTMHKLLPDLDPPEVRLTDISDDDNYPNPVYD